MTNDDERGEGVKDAQNLMTSQVDDPLFCPRHGQLLKIYWQSKSLNTNICLTLISIEYKHGHILVQCTLFYQAVRLLSTFLSDKARGPQANTIVIMAWNWMVTGCAHVMYCYGPL